MPSRHGFRPTRWSEILRIQDPRDPHRRTALNDLCARYRTPLYNQILRKGVPAGDAEDVTQEFITHFITHGGLDRIQREGGLFRNYLLAHLDAFLANRRRAAIRRSRRPAGRPVPLDVLRQRKEFDALVPADRTTPDAAFLRDWALATLDHAFDEVRRQFERDGHPERFDLIRAYFTPGPDQPTRERLADALGMTDIQTKDLIYRTRQRFMESLREAVKPTLGDDRNPATEIALLLKASR